MDARQHNLIRTLIPTFAALLALGVVQLSQLSGIRQVLDSHPVLSSAVTALLTLFAIAMTVVFVVFLPKSEASEALAKVSVRIDELQDKLEEDFFTKLVNINFKYIEKYYLQTQVQAERSFYLSAFASVVALAMVGVGIGMMYGGKTTPAYVTAGAGVLSQFVAAVFFYLYNRTVLRMGEYHQKLVLTQNISLALKTADGLNDTEKQKVLVAIVAELTKDVNSLLAKAPAN
jgi:hypothetical protein